MLIRSIQTVPVTLPQFARSLLHPEREQLPEGDFVCFNVPRIRIVLRQNEHCALFRLRIPYGLLQAGNALFCYIRATAITGQLRYCPVPIRIFHFYIPFLLIILRKDDIIHMFGFGVLYTFPWDLGVGASGSLSILVRHHGGFFIFGATARAARDRRFRLA